MVILSANYVSSRLRDHFPTLYASANGRVAHECILDLPPLKETTGGTAEDIAKRLIDDGFHAPTLSFPVPGTLLAEPMESEPLGGPTPRTSSIKPGPGGSSTLTGLDFLYQAI